MEGTKPLDVKALLIEAERASHKARGEEPYSLRHIVEEDRNKAIRLYKQLGDYYSSTGAKKEAKDMYTLMEQNQAQLEKFLRKFPDAPKHVPSGN